MTLGAFPNQFTGLRCAVCIHISERIVKDNHAAAIGEQMVKHGKTESKRNCFLGTFG